MRQPYETILEELQLLGKLREFQPTVIGTPPLEVDLPTSDIDIACCAADLTYFSCRAQACFGNLEGFLCERIQVRAQPAVCAVFWFQGWEIELFCQMIQIEDQWGVRHFLIERRLLDLEPRLKDPILLLKQHGLKTEPAFAHALKLVGDPYVAVLDLESKSDRELTDLVARSFTSE